MAEVAFKTERCGKQQADAGKRTHARQDANECADDAADKSIEQDVRCKRDGKTEIKILQSFRPWTK